MRRSIRFDAGSLAVGFDVAADLAFDLGFDAADLVFDLDFAAAVVRGRLVRCFAFAMLPSWGGDPTPTRAGETSGEEAGTMGAVAMLRAVILASGFLVACSQGPMPPRGAPPPAHAHAAVAVDAASPQPDQPITDSCATDADCAVGLFPEIDSACCAYRCEFDVVTTSRAAARERDYKARCQPGRCQPHDCPAFEHPTPVCRASRCVDQGYPGLRTPDDQP